MINNVTAEGIRNSDFIIMKVNSIQLKEREERRKRE